MRGIETMARYEIDNTPSPIDFQGKNKLKRALQNAKNLLMCRMGEVPYDRWRGFDMRLFDLPAQAFNEELLPELDKLMAYEPNVDVESAEGKLLGNGQAYIRVTLLVNDELVEQYE